MPAPIKRAASPSRESSLPCPACSGPLEPCTTDHGFVWVCRACRAIAANLAVIRKVAPRQFVKYLWLAALQLGRPSRQLCPSCAQPLLSLGPEVEVSPACKVCCRCFLIWFDEPARAAFRLSSRPAGRDVLTRALAVVDRVAEACDGVVPT